MKIKSLIVVLTAFFCLNMFAADKKIAVKVKAKPVQAKAKTITMVSNESMITVDNSYSGYYNPFYCFARGLNNLVSAGSEVPRCIVYNSVEAPWYGWFTGIFEGSGLVVCRALTGCMDIVTFGLTKKSIFTEQYPESPWDAVWIPRAPQPSPALTNSI